MFKFERDWLMEIKRIAAVFFAIITVFFIGFLITRKYNGENYWFISSAVLKSLTSVGTVIISLIPILALITITPAGEKIYDGAGCVKTNHLPLSKKKLAWKGVKLWLKVYPLWIITAPFIYSLYKSKVETGALSSILIDILIYLLSGSILILAFGVQAVGSIIKSYSENIKLYVIVPIQVILNIVLIYGGIFIGYKLGFDIDNDMRLMVAVFGFLTIVSLIYFLCNFKNIEKVYR